MCQEIAKLQPKGGVGRVSPNGFPETSLRRSPVCSAPFSISANALDNRMHGRWVGPCRGGHRLFGIGSAESVGGSFEVVLTVDEDGVSGDGRDGEHDTSTAADMSVTICSMATATFTASPPRRARVVGHRR